MEIVTDRLSVNFWFGDVGELSLSPVMVKYFPIWHNQTKGFVLKNLILIIMDGYFRWS